MTLGERLASLRSQKGWSQDALAEAVGVSRQSVSKWETDASIPDIDRLVKLSGLFEVSLDELVLGTKPPEPVSPDIRSLWRSCAGWYRQRGYLLGWLISLWGAWGLLRGVWAVGVLYLPMSGVFSAVQLYLTLLPTHILNLLRILMGALLVLHGRRRAGKLRWPHLGWGLLAAGLFGVPRLALLRTGILPFAAVLPSLLASQSPEEQASALMECSGCVLACIAGVLMLFLGNRLVPQKTPSE